MYFTFYLLNEFVVNMHMILWISASVLTHCDLGDFNEILDEYFSSQLQWLMAEIPAVKLYI